ncbi:MAG: dihydroorotate dehydrogenase electron transfer subunit [Methanotrichaceae archaeon]
MRPVNALVISIENETPIIKTIEFDRSLGPMPGQYVMVWIRGLDEIPMSFSDSNRITVHAVGEATRALIDVHPGDSIGLRGPLGNGFSFSGEKILLIGGGVGVAPLAFLGERAKKAGIEVTSLIGFRSSADMIFRSRFKSIGNTIITTDDGSFGIAGYVSAGLKELNLDEFDQIYLCGPELMMWDIISRAKGHAGKIQACINRHFKCAIGVCGSCCLDPDGIRVCVEGPVIVAGKLLNSEFGRYKRGPDGVIGPCKG